MVKFVMSAFLVAAMAHVEEQLAVLSAVTGAPSEAEPPIHDASANMRGRKLNANDDARRASADRSKEREADLLWATKFEKRHRASDNVEYCEKDDKSATNNCACITHENCASDEKCDYKIGCQKDSEKLMVTQYGQECKERCTKGTKGYSCFIKENVGGFTTSKNGHVCENVCGFYGLVAYHRCPVPEYTWEYTKYTMDYCSDWQKGDEGKCYVDVKRPDNAPCVYDSDCAASTPARQAAGAVGNCRGNGQSFHVSPKRRGWCAK